MQTGIANALMVADGQPCLGGSVGSAFDLAMHASQRMAWQICPRFLEVASRQARDGDAIGIAATLLEALCAQSGAAAAHGAWRAGPASGRGIHCIVRGLEAADAALLEAEFDGIPRCVDEVTLHPIDDDPVIGGMLACGRLRALGFASSALATVSDRNGRMYMEVRCLFHSRAEEVDLVRDAMLALVRHAACLIEGVARERMLADTTSRLAAVSDGVVDAIVTIDAAGTVTSVNRAFAAMFGHAPNEIIGRDVTILMRAPDREAHARAMQRRALNPGLPSLAIGRPRELAAVRKDGTVFPIELSLGQIAGAGGGFVGVIRDATERKAIEQSARDADRMAAIGRLAAGLGHDMNNMLFPIRAHLNAVMAVHAADASPRVRGHADQISSSVEHLQHLADTLHFLALDPEERGDGDGVTDIDAWWRTTGPLLSRALHRRARMRPEIASDLPLVGIAQHALTRAVLNLLTNAANAMPEGRSADAAQVTLRARLGSSGAFVVLEVADNGIGMSDEIRRRAGELYFTTRPRGVGAGLGLAMVARVVGNAGGRIEIDSVPGHGTTVRMLLPAHLDGARTGERTVRIDLRDGRMRAVVNAVVENCGLVAAMERDEAPVAWIVDGGSVDALRLEDWIQRYPAAPVVVLGAAPSALVAAYASHGLVQVADAGDYRAIERALTAVFERNEQEKSHV